MKMADTGSNASRRVYHNILIVLPRAALLCLLGLVIIICMALYATHLPDQPTPDGRDASHATAIAFFLVGVLSIWVAIRTLGSGIFAFADGLIVRRVSRRRQFVPWADVAGFELVPARRFNNSYTRTAVALEVLRVDGRPIYCLGASFASPTPEATQMVADLEAELQSHR
jgi:hypothetical protein